MTETPQTPTPPAPTIPASTVLLLRDGDQGLEVFMVLRHSQIEFAGGALVFPGGRVDAADSQFGGASESDPLGAFKIAAIREVFEECGVLLADQDAGLVEGSRARQLGDRYARDLESEKISLAAMFETEKLIPRIGDLVHYSHWITPETRPKRFDTHFFLAATPPGQGAVHDGHESVDSIWITPQQALEDGESGHRSVMFPTRMNLKMLAESSTVCEALAAARNRKVVAVLPRVTRVEGGRIMRIPEEAGYGFSEIVFSGPTSSGP